MIEVASDRRVDRRSFLNTALISAATAIGLTRGEQAVLAQEPGPVKNVAGPTDRNDLRVRIWCEGTAPKTVYPSDIDGAIEEHLSKRGGIKVEKARLADPGCGLTDEQLDATDALIWWGHLRHDDVPDDRVDAIVKRVREGKLGLVALHSSFGSKPFKSLMGMACEPSVWREDGRPEHVKIQAPDHPIAKGINAFTIPRSDMFAEPFAVPEPETLVLTSDWDQGETVRSGMTWTIDKGRVVYLRTGLDAFPVLFHPTIRQLLSNATQWAGRRV